MVQYLLLGFTVLLCASCAQVGTLSGGENDQIAPQIISSVPDFGTTYVEPTLIRLKFDEYVELVNPIETIRLVPNDAKLESKLDKKDLVIQLQGNLKANTTYSICIDGGIKDISEGNDSIYNFVFSTGKSLDSASQTYRIGDAYTKKSWSGITVGLYDTDTSARPRYLCKSNLEGWASLQYLPNQNFFIKAFFDANKNGLIEPNEFQDQKFYPTQPAKDSLVFMLSRPRELNRMHSFKVIPPGILVGHVPEEVELKNLKVNGVNPQAYRISRDSVCLDISDFPAGTLTISNSLDSVSILLTAKDISTKPNCKLKEHKFGTPLELEWNVFPMSTPDLKEFKLMRSDSSLVPIKSIEIKDNKMRLYLATPEQGKVKLLLGANAFKSKADIGNGAISIDAALFGEKNFGSLLIEPKSLTSHEILIVEKAGQEVQRVMISGQQKIKISGLLPGEYQLVIVQDENQNGYWDGIRPETHEPAEQIRRYTKIPKVRAGWDLEVNLE